ncbi:hypothetical protein AK812_SmicGene29289 [Symbiodinium microadriaticum]|uniref:Uncharacterized protein n=1 Tax=Symbiodinium microadriaticum TaxID=2951 RepID=A0A1Q9D294_SYMMI|nr:hypothetical protein AK812_SmicGene29289 [Symbiodinium microadriaticum]
MLGHQLLTDGSWLTASVQREMETCQKECDHMPFMLRLLALMGVLAVLPVVPLLGSYRDACSCECCKGQGCSPKLALFNVAWTAYGFSTLWVAPTVAEDVGDVGGKVLFIITQSIAIASMSSSRRFAELAEAKAVENSYRMAEFGCTGAEVVGAAVSGPVGAPVSVAAFKELQSQVELLQQQVQELSRSQDLIREAPPQVAPGRPEPAFQKKVEAAGGGVEVMLAAGWIPDTMPEGEDCWLLNDDAAQRQASVRKTLESELAKLPAAPAPVPAPTPAAQPAGYGGGLPAGLPGLPGGLGGPGGNAMMQQAQQMMMNNPGMMQQAQQMMQDPNMMAQVQQMMQNPQAMAQLQQMMGGMGR